MNILDPLYFRRIEEQQPIDDEKLDTAFAQFFQTLNTKQRDLWEVFDFLNNQKHTEETQKYYQQGLRDGILIVLESVSKQ